MTYKKELEIFFRFRKSQFGKKSSGQKDDSDDAKESFVNIGETRLRPGWYNAQFLFCHLP